MTTPDEKTLQKWLHAPARTALKEVWVDTHGPDQSPFALFYTAVLRRLRVNPREALQAVDRISAQDRRRLRDLDKVLLHRLTAHALSVAGKFKRAQAVYAQAWKQFERLGARNELAVTGIGWVNTLSQLAHYQKAQQIALQSRSLLAKNDRIRRARLDSNLGNVLILSGQFRAAATQYRKARQSLKALGYDNDAALATNNLGHALLMQGRRREARVYFQEVEKLCLARGLTSLCLYAQAALATVDMMEGKWELGMEKLDDLLRELEKQTDLRAVAHIQKQQAEFLCALGALEKADELARKSFTTYRDLGLRADAAHAAYLHARILVALNRNIDARVRLNAALRFWNTTQDYRARYRTETELAGVFLARGDPRKALQLLKRGGPYLWRHDRGGGGVRSRHLLAETHLRLGGGSKASRLARESFAAATIYPSRLDRPWIALTVARALALTGRGDDALIWARRSVREMETLFLALGTQAMRGQASASRHRIYKGVVELVLSLGGKKAPRLALDLLSRARSPELIEDLLQEPQRLSGPLRASIARIRDELLGLEVSGPEDIRFKHLRKQMRELHRALNRKKASPPTSIKKVIEARGFSKWSRLLKGRSLVFFDQREGDWSAYVINPRRAVTVTPLPKGAEALDQIWFPLRMLMEHAAHLPQRRRRMFLAATQSEAVESLGQLRQAFWDPLSLEPGEVIVVPFGDLYDLPLESLSAVNATGSGGAEEWVVSRLPHPAVLHNSGRSIHANALLLHDRSQGTRLEADRIGRILRKSGMRTKSAHQRSQFAREKRRLGLLHIAAHGSYHRRSWMLNGIRLSDGWLGFEQLRRPQTRDSLMYFGSCESGLGSNLPGAELGGWLSAGLGAGARELILSLWKIDDESALAFAEAFYSEWCRGVPAVQAAAEARRLLQRKTPHPFAWASFLAVG